MAATSPQRLANNQADLHREGEPDLPLSHARQLLLDLGHNAAMTEADFLVGAANQLAFDHLTAFPNWAGSLTLVVGPAKSGKTHLAHIFAEHAEARIVRPGELALLAEEGGQTPLVIEDIDRREYDEQAVFHLLNQSMRDARPVLMTARRPVAQWPFRTADVLSRARLAAHFELEMPDDIQLSQMFVKLFGDRQIAVEPKVISYLATRMERSAEAVFKLVALMDKLALSRRAPVSRAIAADALKIMEEMGKEERELADERVE